MGLSAVSVDVPIPPAHSWEFSDEEAAIALRAVEGGLLDDMVEAYKGAGSNESWRPLNAEASRRISAVLGRVVAFPPDRVPDGDQGAWEVDGWRPLAQALVRRFGAR